VQGCRIAVWGLAFKAGTNDLRDSPSLEVCKRLVAAGADVCAFDPAVNPTAVTDLGFTHAETSIGACFGAEALVVLTEWPEFAAIDASLVAAAMSGDVVFDTRNVLDINEWTSAGLRLVTVGRGSPDPVTNSANANAA